MTNRWIGKFMAVAMAVVVPASIMSAETRGAMLFASNSAILNGTAIQHNTAIFAGDRIAVPDKSEATITLTGSSVLVPQGSSITFNGDSVALDHQTAVAIMTTVGLAAQVENIKVSPVDKTAKFQVGRFNGKIFVAAKEGTVAIAGLSTNPTILTEGKTTMVTDPEPQKPGAVPATTGGAGVGEIPTWVAVLIGLAAAGAAAAVAIATTGKPASPKLP